MQPEELLIALVVAGVFGALTANIAANKGRNGVEWFFLGAIFPVLGLFASLVIAKDEEVIAERAIAKGERKRCSHCQELVMASATKCPHCQGSLSETEGKEPPEPSETPEPPGETTDESS